MALGISSNLTVNETENAYRYDHLLTKDEPRVFHNRLDRGCASNCAEFW